MGCHSHFNCVLILILGQKEALGELLVFNDVQSGYLSPFISLFDKATRKQILFFR